MLLELDERNYFFGQLDFVNMVPKILEIISSYSSAQIVDEKKGAVVGEAAITLRWIVIRCGHIA